MRRAAILLTLACAGCDQMATQPRYDSYEPSKLFADHTSLQAPPVGTVARDKPALAAALATPPPMSRALLERGQQRYGIYCTPCHDAAGYGDGVVPSRGYPHPPSLHEARLVAADDAHLVDVIGHGYGLMAQMGDRIAPPDRWAIVAYIRALQLSQHAEIGALSPNDASQLK